MTPSMTPSTLDELELRWLKTRRAGAGPDWVWMLDALPDLIAAARENARLRDVLWRTRRHEANYDGSPCWCETVVDSFTHEPQCGAARAILQQTTDAGPEASDG